MKLELSKPGVRELRKKGIVLGRQLVITRRCNLRCVHCYPRFLKKEKDPSLKELKKRIDELADEKCLFLIITGGEPLVRKDFWEIVRHARARSFALILETNGLLITSEAADKLAGADFWSVDVTVLGAKAGTHDTITRTPGSFKRAIRAIKTLKRRKMRVRLQCSLLELNKKEKNEIRALAQKLGAEADIYPAR